MSHQKAPVAYLTKRNIALSLVTLGIGIGCYQFSPGTDKKTSDNRIQKVLKSSEVNEDISTEVDPVEQVSSEPHTHSSSCGCGDQTAAGATSLVTVRPTAIAFTKEIREKLLNHSKGQLIQFMLPGGGLASGIVDGTTDENGRRLSIQGTLSAPQEGRFLFTEQTLPGGAGDMFGAVYFNEGDVAYSVEPGADGTPELKEKHVDQVICQGYTIPEELEQSNEWAVEEIPADHPDLIDIPSYQNGVIPLSSHPNSVAVVYLDFDGEEGPHTGWNSMDAASFNLTNSQIKDLWARTAEEFAPFNINVTTDLQVYLDAPQNSRQRCIITPTTAVYLGSAGGVAYVNGFNSSGDTPCWCFYTGNSGALVIAHEVGHTLGLSHDGNSSAGYDSGHSTTPGHWGPIMGAPYGSAITHWSRGEYANANQTQDDLVIIDQKNNVSLRTDDHGSDLATASLLEVFSDDSVVNGGVIGTDDDFDAFKFTVTASSDVSFTVNATSPGPNLDVLAEIVNSAGSVEASDNPAASLNATVAATLPAGDYFLRITGEGFGDAATGYSSYGSLGFYTVTGTAPNAIQPDRFSVAENSTNSTAVGTVTPRNTHANPIVYSISSGNSSGAFAIDPATGALTVIDSAQFDYETLSTYYEDPATFELFVDISNATVPSLNENVRVVVTVTDVNEAPEMTIVNSISVLEHTLVGSELLQATFTDGDRYDIAPTWSISSGNTGGAFAIDSSTGSLTVASTLDATVQASYALEITVTDSGSPALSDVGNLTIDVVDIVEGYVPGTITQSFYEGISGNALTGLTASSAFPSSPNSLSTLTSIYMNGHGDNYGSTIRGYVIPPTTGSYTFWIAGDDQADLRLSTNADPANSSVIATLTSAVSLNDWTSQSNQQSSTVTMTAGQPYYIEVRHKEGGGGDHISVAWQGPGISQQVVSAAYLAPYSFNYAPHIASPSITIQDDIYSGHIVGGVSVTDLNNTDTHSNFSIVSGNGNGYFSIDSASGEIYLLDNAGIMAGASYELGIQVTDSGSPAEVGSGTVTINVVSEGSLVQGSIEHQIFSDITGSTVSDLTSDPKYPNSPDSTSTLASFDSGQDIANNFGSRIRAYVTPPTTGSYTFYVCSDDASELYLSSDDTEGNKTLIASVTEWAPYSDWTKFTSQKSTSITLTAGERYYIEALHKEGGGGDHVQVAWTGPDFATTTVVAGAYLEKYISDSAPSWDADPYAFTANNSNANGTVVGTVSATDSSADTLVYNIVSGDDAGAYAIDHLTGLITIADHYAMSGGVNVITVGVQDNAVVYNETTTDITITVTGSNAPQVTAASLSVPENSGSGVTVGTVAFTDPDAETWVHSIDSGNEAGFFAINPSSGAISVTASAELNYEVGISYPLTARVTDSNGFYGEALITINVSDVDESTLTGVTAWEEAVHTGTAFAFKRTDSLAGNSTTTVDLSELNGDATYEFLVEAEDTGQASVDLLAANGQVFKFEQWNDLDLLGVTQSGVADWTFTAEAGQVLASPYGAVHHIVFVADTTGGETRVYIDGVHAGTLLQTLNFSSASAVLGSSNLRSDSSTGIHAFAAYNAVLSATEIAEHAVAAVNLAPLANDATFAVSEMASVSAAVGSVVATDPNKNTLSYAITAGNTGTAFTIDNSGNITTVAALDFETTTQYILTVLVTDSGALTDTASVTVNVSNETDEDNDDLDDTWEVSHYGSLATVGNTADSDEDGYNTFKEMAFGTDPKAVSKLSDHMTTNVIDDGGVDKLELSFRRPINHANLGVVYQLKSSTTLSAWGNDETPVTATTPDADGITEWLSFLFDPNDAAKKFIQMEATPAP